MTARSNLKCGRLRPATAFTVGLLLLGGPFPEARAAMREFTGEGGGIGPFKVWSDPNNWHPVGIPQNGEDLRFYDSGLGFGDDPPPMINDLTGLTVRSMEFHFTMQIINGLSLNWQLGGNEIGITDSIMHTGASESELRINCPIKLFANASIENFDNIASGPCDLYLNGAIDLNGHNLAITVAEDDMVVSSGSITGQGNLNLHGAGGGLGGRIRLAGTNANTFQGSITLYGAGNYGARLILEKQSPHAVPGSLFVRQGALVQFSRSDQIADTATVVVYGGGKFDLNGHDDLIGHLTLSTAISDTTIPFVSTAGGVLSVAAGISSLNSSVGNPPSAHSIQGRLELPSGEHTLWVDNGDLDIQARMTGFGNFTKIGNGTLILSASNSFNSSIMINEGILDVRHNWGLGDTAGSTAIGNGVLTLSDVAIGEELLFALGGSTGGDLPGSVLNVVGAASWAGQVALYTNLNVNGGDMTFTGPISGEGGLGCFSGGTIQLGGSLPNTYTGLTLSRSPLLVLAKSGGARAFSGALQVGSSSGPQREVRWLGSAQAPNSTVTLHKTALINLNNFNDTFGPITFNGGAIATGTGLLGINGLVTVNDSGVSSTISGRMELLPGYREFRVLDTGPVFAEELDITASISGSGHLQKTGYGDLRLAGSNSYSGLTFLDEGTVSVYHPAALGAGTTGTQVANGATLGLFTDGIVPELVSLRGGGFFGFGALYVEANPTLRSQFPAIYACLDLTTNATVQVAAGSRLVADGFVSGTGPWFKNGPGTLVFSNANANTYTGDTIIQYGTLELRKPNNTLAVPGNLVIGPANAAAPATVQCFQNGGLSASATVTVNAYSLLDLNGFNQSLNRLNLNDGGDVQTGAGTLSFPGGGPVAVGSLNVQGSQASSSFSGRIGLPPNSSLYFTVAPYAPGTIGVTDPELVVSALIPAPVENVNFERAGLYKSGAGELRLSGNNTFNGRVDVAEGTVSVGSATALGSTFDATYVTGAASLALINGLTIAGETLSLNSTHTAALHNRGGNNTWTGLITLARPSAIAVNQDWTLTASGAIGGSGSLMKHGAGTLTLGGAGNNTFAGNTHVNEGTLLMAKASGLQAVPADLIVGQTNGSTAAIARYLNHDQVWANIVVNGGGLLDVNGYDEYAGTLTLNGGGDVQTGAGRLFTTDLTVSPAASGNPSFITGRLGLYPGAHQFTVNASAVPLAEPECNLTANILEYSTAASLTKAGAGVLRLSGTNTYLGSTTLSGGTLWVDGPQPQSAVQAGAGTLLKGSGTVGTIYFVGLNTSIMPGSSPGILTCGGLAPIAPASGTLHVELNGITPGAGYDQLDVRGPVNLTGMSLNASLGFASAVSNQFTIIANDGADAVAGTFTGLPQGKKLYIGGELFQISYTGGTGNDVVLTRLVTPPPPELTIERAATNAVRLIWPTNDPPFSLQTTTNLPATNWLAALPLPTVIGTNNVVTNTVAGTNRFYRLVSP